MQVQYNDEEKNNKFEEIYRSSGFIHITDKILLELDMKSLMRTRLVCKALYHSIQNLGEKPRLRDQDLKTIRKIRREKFLVHPNWRKMFDAICQEGNFYRIRYVMQLLQEYQNESIWSCNIDGRTLTEHNYVSSGMFFST